MTKTTDLKEKLLIHRAIQGSSLSTTQKMVAICILFATDSKFVTFIANDTIAARASVSPRSLDAVLKKLADSMLISRSWGSPATRYSGKRSMITTVSRLDAWLHFSTENPAKKPNTKKNAKSDENRTEKADDTPQPLPDENAPKTGDPEPNTPQPLRCENTLSETEHTANFADNTPQPLPPIRPVYPSIKNTAYSIEPLSSSSHENAAPIGAVASQQPSQFQESFDLYNSTAARCGWKLAEHLTAAHERLFAEIAKDFSFKEWTEALERAAVSEFIASKKRENWPTLKWFLNEHNVTKILEGHYNDHRSQPESSVPAMTFDDIMKNVDHRFVRHDDDDDDDAIIARPVQPTRADVEARTIAAWKQSLADAERQGEAELAATYRSMLKLDSPQPSAIH